MQNVPDFQKLIVKTPKYTPHDKNLPIPDFQKLIAETPKYTQHDISLHALAEAREAYRSLPIGTDHETRLKYLMAFRVADRLCTRERRTEKKNLTAATLNEGVLKALRDMNPTQLVLNEDGLVKNKHNPNVLSTVIEGTRWIQYKSLCPSIGIPIQWMYPILHKVLAVNNLTPDGNVQCMRVYNGKRTQWHAFVAIGFAKTLAEYAAQRRPGRPKNP